eukprot:TRINITY_DN5665_c0_g1_i1.p1 TRINITY_DN5665_c0_g1~~TRINITY_DN5665_c0_g1_i1.p1  ORF type:complete len:900 (+),score=245.72 TRINITY_DN5665_c0_g1_i1:26-2725(+)
MIATALKIYIFQNEGFVPLLGFTDKLDKYEMTPFSDKNGRPLPKEVLEEVKSQYSKKTFEVVKQEEYTDEEGYVYGFSFKNSSFTRHKWNGLCVRKRVLLFKTLETTFPNLSFANLEDTNDLFKKMDTNTVLENMINPHSGDVPILVEEIIDFLKINGPSVEGIFRLSGAENKSWEIIQKYSNGEKVNLEEWDIIDVATALKKYLKFKHPLLTYELYENFLDFAKDQENFKEENMGKLKELLSSLPLGHRLILGKLFDLFNLIIENAQNNKMHSENISTCFSKSIFFTDQTDLEEMADFKFVNILIEYIIKNNIVLIERVPQRLVSFLKNKDDPLLEMSKKLINSTTDNIKLDNEELLLYFQKSEKNTSNIFFDHSSNSVVCKENGTESVVSKPLKDNKKYILKVRVNSPSPDSISVGICNGSFDDYGKSLVDSSSTVAVSGNGKNTFNKELLKLKFCDVESKEDELVLFIDLPNQELSIQNTKSLTKGHTFKLNKLKKGDYRFCVSFSSQDSSCEIIQFSSYDHFDFNRSGINKNLIEIIETNENKRNNEFGRRVSARMIGNSVVPFGLTSSNVFKFDGKEKIIYSLSFKSHFSNSVMFGILTENSDINSISDNKEKIVLYDGSMFKDKNSAEFLFYLDLDMKRYTFIEKTNSPNDKHPIKFSEPLGAKNSLVRLGFVLSNPEDQIEIVEYANANFNFEKHPKNQESLEISFKSLVSKAEKGSLNVLSSILYPFWHTKIVYHLSITKRESKLIGKDSLSFGFATHDFDDWNSELFVNSKQTEGICFGENKLFKLKKKEEVQLVCVVDFPNNKFYLFNPIEKKKRFESGLPDNRDLGIRMFVTLGTGDEFKVKRVIASSIDIEQIENFVITNMGSELKKGGFSENMSRFNENSFDYQLF